MSSARKLDEDKQKAFIENYEKLLNSLGDDEAVLFADAVHPTMRRGLPLLGTKTREACDRTDGGRDRMNIHSTIDLTTGRTRWSGVVDRRRRLDDQLLESLETLFL